MNAFKVLLFIFAAFAVRASTVTEDFLGSLNYDQSSTTLVWNHALGYLHPTLTVTGIFGPPPGAAAVPDRDFSVGQGIYGKFDETTYARFSINGDLSNNTIRLDTSVYTSLDVTDFYLADDWILQPVGDNPLIIRSLSNVEVLGIIECNGDPGEDASADLTVIPQGGQGRCGGGAGGNGGVDNLTQTPTAGSPSGAGAGGGQQGLGFHAANGGDGGAGGGAYGNGAAGDGVSPSASADALAGASSDDPTFTVEGGGGGGGGGYAMPGLSTGAGGGGGGGSVYIYAVGNVHVSADANAGIRAYGGRGGRALGALLGGAGGGGGGGSIVIWARGDIAMDANNQVDANFGAAGTVGSTSGAGGVGSVGRTWLSWGGNIAGNERPLYTLTANGMPEYKVAAQVAVSGAYDLGNTTPRLTGITVNQSLAGASTVAVEAAGSNDNFSSDDTGWTTPSSVNGKRYVKFRLTLTNADPLNLSKVESVGFDFEGGRRDSFGFVTACGQ